MMGRRCEWGKTDIPNSKRGAGRRDAHLKERVLSAGRNEGPTRKIFRECPVAERTDGWVHAWADGRMGDGAETAFIERNREIKGLCTPVLFWPGGEQSKT